MKKKSPPPVPPEERTLDALSAAVYDTTGRLVAAVMPPGEQDTARRLVACWNAFRGTPTADIERGRVEIRRVTNHVDVGTNSGSIQIGGLN